MEATGFYLLSTNLLFLSRLSLLTVSLDTLSCPYLYSEGWALGLFRS